MVCIHRSSKYPVQDGNTFPIILTQPRELLLQWESYESSHSRPFSFTEQGQWHTSSCKRTIQTSEDFSGLETYDSHPGDSPVLVLCVSTFASADGLLRPLLDVPHGNCFTFRGVTCHGSNRPEREPVLPPLWICFPVSKEANGPVSCIKVLQGAGCPASLPPG